MAWVLAQRDLADLLTAFELVDSHKAELQGKVMVEYLQSGVFVPAVQFFPDTKFISPFDKMEFEVQVNRSVVITTKRGQQRCDFGDWIIALGSEEFIVLSKEAFAYYYQAKE